MQNPRKRGNIMKKIITAFLCATILVASLAITAGASAWNPAGGCKVNNTIMKTDPARVQKDGVIGVGEYTEIEINRDPETSDLMLSFLKSEQFVDAEAFLNNVHFYMSWDEVHGLNVAATAELLETPKNENQWPPETLSTDENGFSFPGDDFLWQFGLMFKTFVTDEMSIQNTSYYRSFSKNTATGDLMYGYYWQNGYTGNYNMVAGTDYTVTINDKLVTYEFSCPLADILPESDLANGLPVEGAMIRYALTATGGSEGTLWSDDVKTYAVSVGDFGYMSGWSQWRDGASHAHGTFTSEMIQVDTPVATDDNTTAIDTTNDGTTVIDTNTDEPGTDDNGTTQVPTQPATTKVVTDVVTSYVEVTDDAGNVVTDEDGNKVTDVVSEVVTSIVTDAPTENAGNGTSAVPTGSPMIIAAVVAAISACGVVVAKKRK